MIHLAAVFLPPMAFQARGSRGISPSIAMLLEPIAAYCQFLYLDRGYAFFAPDPGPSHLVRAKLTSGTERMYPNLDDQWPRLLYHRHFMLAEFLNESYQPAMPAEASRLVGPALSAEELQAWRFGRKRYEAIEASMAEHVQHAFADPNATLERVEHTIPDFVLLMNDPIPLTDERLYVTLEDIPITLETLTAGLPTLPNPNASPVPGTPARTSSVPAQPKVTEPVPAPPGERDPMAIRSTTQQQSEPTQQEEPKAAASEPPPESEEETSRETDEPAETLGDGSSEEPTSEVTSSEASS